MASTFPKKTHKELGFQRAQEEDEEVIGSYMESLPPEIIMEILSRVPTLDLAKLSYVCRRWRNILKQPLFRPLHCSRSLSNNHNGVLVQKGRCNELYVVDLNDKTSPRKITIKMPCINNVSNFSFVGSCNGLLCLGSIHTGLFLIVNPLTRKHVFTPTEPSYFVSARGFGFDPVNNLFKVIMRRYYYDPDVRICDLSRGRMGKWREIKGTAFRLSSSKPACFVNGRLHWTTHKRDDSLVIISFDLTDEEFRLVMIPHCLRKRGSVDLFAMGGCLCIFLSQCSNLQIWVMKEYGVKESWVKECDANPIIPRCLPSHLRIGQGGKWQKTLKALGSVRDGEVCFQSVVIKSEIVLLSFDLRCGQFQVLELKRPVGLSIVHTASLNWM